MAAFGTGGGFSFGSPATSTATTSTGLSFATTTTSSNSGFKFGALGSTVTAVATVAPAPTPSFNFNLNPTNATPSTGTSFLNLSSTAAGLTPAAVPIPAASLIPTATPIPAAGLIPAVNPIPAANPIAAANTSGFSFAKPVATANATPALSAAPPTAAGGFSFSTPASSTGLPFFSTPGTSTPAALFPSASASLSTTTTTTTLGAAGTAGNATNLSMRQLEEKLNKWLVELKEQEERFVRQAAHVNAWDQILQNGHNQVQTLKETLHTVKSDQSRLEAEIDFIRGQQEELERLLEPLESATSAGAELHQGDRQRDNMYYLTQSLDSQLRQMTKDLSRVIEHVNANGSAWEPSDPASQVARILSAHMDSLKWVDQSTTLLAHKVDDLARIATNRQA